MVDEALNDGARLTGAWRGTGATVRAVGAAVSLQEKIDKKGCFKRTQLLDSISM